MVLFGLISDSREERRENDDVVLPRPMSRLVECSTDLELAMANEFQQCDSMIPLSDFLPLYACLMHQVFPLCCTDSPRRSLSDIARSWKRLGVTWRSTSCYRRTKAPRTEVCTLRSLICVGSRVTAILEDDADDNEMQSHIGWSSFLFSTHPPRYSLLPRVLECRTKGKSSGAKISQSLWTFYLSVTDATINFVHRGNEEIGKSDWESSFRAK